MGANVVAGVDPEGILRSSPVMIKRKLERPSPSGDGHAAERTPTLDRMQELTSRGVFFRTVLVLKNTPASYPPPGKGH